MFALGLSQWRRPNYLKKTLDGRAAQAKNTHQWMFFYISPRWNSSYLPLTVGNWLTTWKRKSMNSLSYMVKDKFYFSINYLVSCLIERIINKLTSASKLIVVPVQQYSIYPTASTHKKNLQLHDFDGRGCCRE